MNSSRQTTLYRAPWLVPVATPVIADGAVLVGGGRILAVGPYRSLRHGGADRLVQLDGALLPRLINCHSHLELAVYGGACRARLTEGQPASFPDWIRELLRLRAQTSIDPAARKGAAVDLFGKMAKEGVGLVLDTGNLVESGEWEVEKNAGRRFLLEMLGFSWQTARPQIAELESLESNLAVTAHAPYSTHPVLLKAIKARCRKMKQPFSIHTAESAEENEFLAGGSGPFRHFLEERGVLDEDFRAPGCSPVQYLDRLGLLDDRTLCVHCVQTSDPDLEVLVRRGVTVCLCPGSNTYLGVGRAPVERMAKAGLSLCLGTDSPASNPECSMWNEMQLLSRQNPGLAPETILAMATLGGATFLGVEAEFGSLEAGKTDGMVLIRQHFSDQRQLLEAVVASGPSLQIDTLGYAYD